MAFVSMNTNCVEWLDVLHSEGTSAKWDLGFLINEIAIALCGRPAYTAEALVLCGFWDVL